MHNNYLELRAIREAITRSKLSNVFIRVFSDNMASVHMVNKLYSPVPTCALEIKHLMTYVLAHGCAIKADHVPGPQNSVADYLSRVDVSYQRVSNHVWQFLCDSLLHPLTCDRFASPRDHMLPFFNTYMPSAARAPIDAFAQCDWMLYRNWCHPPAHILDKLVHFLDGMSFAPSCVIFTPYWPAHSWFSPLLNQADWVLRVAKATPPLTQKTPFDYCLFGIQTPLTMWGPALHWLKEPPAHQPAGPRA